MVDTFSKSQRSAIMRSVHSTGTGAEKKCEADISFLSREVVRSTFMEDLRAFLKQHVDETRLEFDWKDEKRDPTGKYNG
jgi:hypothetical protein